MLQNISPSPACTLRRGCWSTPCSGYRLPSATLDVLEVSSGTTGLLVSDAHLWMGLEQVGGSGSQVWPSLTSEFEESLFKSDSSSELRGKRARWKGNETFQGVQQALASALAAVWAFQRKRCLAARADVLVFLLSSPLLQDCNLV